MKEKEKWIKSIEHRGSLLSRLFNLVFHFASALHQPSPSAAGERVSEEIEGKGWYMYTANPDLSCFPLLTSPLSLTRSPSPGVFLALPPQLSLIACEVINGFHLTSSPSLRRAPTNKTRAQHTNCPSEEP